MHFNLILTFFLIFFNKTFSENNNDYFSSIWEMEKLLNIETMIIENFQNYIQNSEKRIDDLKIYLNNMKINNITSIDKTNKINDTNFITSFLQIKHIHEKITEIENNINLSNYDEQVLDVIKNVTQKSNLPSLEDIDGILRAIARLQATYNLDINSVLGDRVDVLSKFSYAECYNIGVYLFNLDAFEKAIEWFMESLKKYKNPTEINDTITKEKILEYIAWCAYHKGDYKMAIKYSDMLLRYNITYTHMEENIEWYKLYLKEGKPFSNDGEVDKRTQLYNKGCRGELQKPAEEIRELYCKYLTQNHPFLKLARVKYEELNKNPLVILFHDVVSDNEIERLKQAVKGNLKRARVWDVLSGTEQKSEIRTSKFAWLDILDDEVVPTLRQRMQDISNLASRSYEKLQIANYGIGGHYDMHHDFHYESPNETVQKYAGHEYGNRIATLMFYLSDVRKGGATVLPYMNITIRPIKGTAVLWYNLHANGEPDIRTMHAACPVIEGSKWVANQWIHEREQEFRRPCELIDDSKIKSPY